MFAEHSLQRLVIDRDRPVAFATGHRLRRDQRVDDAFFDCLDGGEKERDPCCSLPSARRVRGVADLAAASFAVENAMKMSPDPLPA